MTRHCLSPWTGSLLALVLTLPASAAPVPVEQTTPLAQVPATAPIVVQLHGYERTYDRLETLIKNAVPELAALARVQIDEFLKKVLGGRQLKGLTREGAIFLVFPEIPQSGTAVPKMAFVVPVTSYAAFRDGLLKEGERKQMTTDSNGIDSVVIERQRVYFVNRKNGYAVLSVDADVANSFTKRFYGLDGKLTPSTAQRFLEADLSVYVDMEAVIREHGQAFRQAHSAMQLGFNMLPDSGFLEQIKRLIDMLYQVPFDTRMMLLTADLLPEGLKLHAEAMVQSDSKTNALLREWQSLPLEELGKQPGGQMLYSGMAFSAAQMKSLPPLLWGSSAARTTDESQSQQKTIAALLEAGPRRRTALAMDWSNGMQVWQYDNPARAVAAQLDAFKAFKKGWSYQEGLSLFSTLLQDVPVVKEAAEKHGNFTFHSVRMKWDLEATVARLLPGEVGPQPKKMLIEQIKYYVGEGANLWFGTDGKVVVLVNASDWPTARALVDGYQKKNGMLAESQPFRDVAKHLPMNASSWMLLDVPRYSEAYVKQLAISSAGAGPSGLPPGFEKPAVKAQTTYLGLAANLEPGRAAFDLWFAAASAHDIYKMYLERILPPLTGDR